VQKFASNHKESPHFVAPKSNAIVFTVNHYAGTVLYDGEGFLEKNRDTLVARVVV
jgi:myosin heavy subunit